MKSGRSWIALLAAGAAMAMIAGSADAATGYVPPAVAGPQVVKFPEDAQRAGEQGTVAIRVFVTDSGRISRLRMTQSSGSDRLDTAAIESVLAWKFNPAEQDGRPVSGDTVVKVVYKVPEPGQSQ